MPDPEQHMKFWKRTYSIWSGLALVFFFFLFLIPFLICVPFERLHFIALRLHHVWARGYFILSFIPVRRKWKFQIDPGQQYILCANHFSYLDIPAMGLVPIPFKFVGKSQLGKIPLFGVVYNNIHITVNRSSYRSRAVSLDKARRAIKAGFNLAFFPEGGIRVKEYPHMADFKDGAFRIAAENNVPIIPVTFPRNFHILKNDHKFEFDRQPCLVIYHQPVWPGGSGDEQIKELKTTVYRVIQDELIQQSR